MGFDPQLRTDVEDKSLKEFTPTAAQHIGEMQEQQMILTDKMNKAKEAMAQQYNKHHKPILFRVGDYIYLYATNIKTTQPNDKLDHQQLGPFYVISIIGLQAYKLELLLMYQ